VKRGDGGYCFTCLRGNGPIWAVSSLTPIFFALSNHPPPAGGTLFSKEGKDCPFLSTLSLSKEGDITAETSLTNAVNQDQMQHQVAALGVVGTA